MFSPKFFLEVFVVISSVSLSVFQAKPVGLVNNQLRYSVTIPNSVPNEQIFNYAASNVARSISPNLLSYKIVNNNEQLKAPTINTIHNNFHRSRLLDDEDKVLLEKFYRETKNSDPYNSIIWDKQNQANQLKALVDLDDEAPVQFKALQKNKTRSRSELILGNGWTLEPEFNDFDDDPKRIPFNVPAFFNKPKQEPAQAKYAPTIKLLTSYDPVAQLSQITSPGSGNFESQRLQKGATGGSRIVGATLISQDQNTSPDVSSKSAADAIQLHNELFQTPPNDGKVRVRMYYHRAIHDDSRLYGNGPWKYWGHGWGMEFGFDPKRQPKDNYYQKGYTIERAFGRDFCKDKNMCRKPDPKFFDDPKNVGQYSKEQYLS